MTPCSQRLAVLALVASVVAQPALSQSASDPSPHSGAAALIERIAYPKPQAPQSGNDSPAAAAESGLDPSVAQSIGCVIAGTIGTTVALSAGGENVVNIVAGGLVAPINQIALYTAIVGVVFGTFCSVGQAVTPLYLHTTKQPANTDVKIGEGLTCKPLNQPAAGMTSMQDLLIPASRVTTQEPKNEIDMATPQAFRRRK